MRLRAYSKLLYSTKHVQNLLALLAGGVRLYGLGGHPYRRGTHRARISVDPRLRSGVGISGTISGELAAVGLISTDLGNTGAFFRPACPLSGWRKSPLAGAGCLYSRAAGHCA